MRIPEEAMTAEMSLRTDAFKKRADETWKEHRAVRGAIGQEHSSIGTSALLPPTDVHNLDFRGYQVQSPSNLVKALETGPRIPLNGN